MCVCVCVKFSLYVIFFVQSSVGRHLGWFYFLAVANSAAMHMSVQASLCHAAIGVYTVVKWLAHMYDSSVLLFVEPPY